MKTVLLILAGLFIIFLGAMGRVGNVGMALTYPQFMRSAKGAPGTTTPPAANSKTPVAKAQLASTVVG